MKSVYRKIVDNEINKLGESIRTFVFNDKRKYGRRLKYGGVWLNNTQKRKLQSAISKSFPDYNITVGETKLYPWGNQYCGTTVTFKRKQ